MYFNLDDRLNDFLKIIVKNAQIQNVRVFFVGGIVRDHLLDSFSNEIVNQDVDIILNTNAIKFIQRLHGKIKIKSIHKDFATVKIQYEGMEIDIAST